MQDRCPEHDKLLEMTHRIDTTVARLDVRINGSIDDIHSHISSGMLWRITIATIGAGWIISLLVLAYSMGMTNKQVTINTERWNRLLEKNPVVIHTQGIQGEIGKDGKAV